jgi:hypothetical protein
MYGRSDVGTALAVPIILTTVRLALAAAAMVALTLLGRSAGSLTLQACGWTLESHGRGRSGLNVLDGGDGLRRLAALLVVVLNKSVKRLDQGQVHRRRHRQIARLTLPPSPAPQHRPVAGTTFEIPWATFRRKWPPC